MNFLHLNVEYFLIVLFIAIIILLLIIRKTIQNSAVNQGIVIGNSQIIGKRDKQEDSFSTISNQNGVMAVLGDGMGGFLNGKVASSVAVNVFINEFSRKSNIVSVEDFFVSTSRLSNKEILKKSKGVKSGTTLISVVISEEYLYWASIGDSAIVLFRKGEFINLNKKHIFEMVLKEQFSLGKITKSEVLKNPKKKRLTSYVGHEGFNDIEINEEPIKLKRGDKVLLFSDGVYNTLSEIEIEKILLKRTSPQKTAESITDEIMRKNSPKQDNATIIILQKKW